MNAEMVAKVIEVACLTEDRDAQEQRAMIDLAFWADNELSRFTHGRTGILPRLVDLVESTYNPSEGRRIAPTAAQQRQLERLTAKFVPCTKCNVLMGEHAVACLESDLEAARAGQ